MSTINAGARCTGAGIRKSIAEYSTACISHLGNLRPKKKGDREIDLPRLARLAAGSVGPFWMQMRDIREQ